MKKIVVFGDSYVRYDWVSAETDHMTWPYYLSQLLDIPIITFGISGSGLNYSMFHFNNYVNSNDYDPEDIIIWALTNEQRLFDFSMPNPSMGIFYNLLDVLDNRPPEEREWIQKNKKHALWVMENILHPSINYSIIKIVSFLQVWASRNTQNIVIPIRCFTTLPEGEKITKLLDLIDETENFFPILKENDTLSVISGAEFNPTWLHNYMLEKNANAPGLDYRVNHISPENRKILANQLFRIINNRSLRYWNRSEFKEGLYTNKSDIDKINIQFF